MATLSTEKEKRCPNQFAYIFCCAVFSVSVAASLSCLHWPHAEERADAEAEAEQDRLQMEAAIIGDVAELERIEREKLEALDII